MKKIIIALILLLAQATLLFGQGSTFDPLRIGSRIGSGTPGSLLFVDLNKKLAQDNANLFWNDSLKRFGIGTASPASMLDVFEGTVLNSSGNDFDTQIKGLTDDNLFYVNAGNDRVGFGINNPSEYVHIHNDQNANTRVFVTNPNAGASATAQVAVSNDSDTQGSIRIVAVGTGFNTAGAFIKDAGVLSAENRLGGGLSIVSRTALASMRFYTGGVAAANERMRIANTGNVSIGAGGFTSATLLELEDANATTGIQISNTAADGDPFWGFALSGTRKWTGFADDGDGDDFKINDGTISGGTTRFRIDGTDGDIQTYQGMIRKTTRITSDTTLDATHHKVYIDTDGGAITITLPAGIDGREYPLYNTGSNDVTVTPDGSELIDGINGSKAFAMGMITLTYETTEGWR